MKTVIAIVSTLVFVLFLGVIFLAALMEITDVFNKNPCEASEGYLADTLLGKKFHITLMYPKNYCMKCYDYDSTKVQCNIIYSTIEFEDSSLTFIGDSIINEFAKLFWGFPGNKNVDSLYLTIKNVRRTANSTDWQIVYSNLSTKNISKENLANEPELSKTKPKIKLINESEGWIEEHSIKTKTLNIELEASHDYNDFESVVDDYYKQYIKIGILKDSVIFNVDIKVDYPTGGLISSKEYEYSLEHLLDFYHKSKE